MRLPTLDPRPRFFAYALALAYLFVPCPSKAWDDAAWFDPAFIEAHAQSGGSGFLATPSPDVLPRGLLTAGIHRYRLKAGWGALDIAELGISTELDSWHLDDAEKNNLFYGRVRFLDRLKHGISLSVGAEGIGLEDLGAERSTFIARDELKHEDRVYVVAGREIPGLDWAFFSLGYGSGALAGHGFGSLSVVALPGLLAITEYDGAWTNLGARLLLSTQIKLDLALMGVQDIDGNKPFARVLDRNIRFGVSYTERWP